MNKLNLSKRYIGIDLHTNKFNCCLIDDDGTKLNLNFELIPDSLDKFYKYITSNTYIMFEASTNSFNFYDLLKHKAKEIIIANPHKLKLISFAEEKTDKIDAEKLVKYLKLQIKGEEELIKPVYVPEQTIRELRSLFTTYRLLGRQIISTKNRIHSILKQNLYSFRREAIFGKFKRETIKNLPMDGSASFQIGLLFDELEYLEDKKEIIKQKIKLVGSKYIKEINILTSMSGISIFTAIALISDIADISRFKSSKKLTSYLRSTPGVDSSNETIKNKKTSRYGRKLSLSLLTQSYNHFKRSNPRLNRWSNNNVGRKKPGVIRMALLRNVIAEIFHMLNKNEYHWYRDKELHNKKMNKYYKFLEKNDITLKKIA